MGLASTITRSYSGVPTAGELETHTSEEFEVFCNKLKQQAQVLPRSVPIFLKNDNTRFWRLTSHSDTEVQSAAMAVLNQDREVNRVELRAALFSIHQAISPIPRGPNTGQVDNAGDELPVPNKEQGRRGHGGSWEVATNILELHTFQVRLAKEKSLRESLVRHT